MKKTLCGVGLAMLLSGPAFSAVSVADIQITEWMYSGGSGEFVEFTNMGNSAVDFAGWSYDDESRLAGVFDLSGFGLVGVGESVIITESAETDFRLDWSLAAGVKVLGGYTNNLSRGDEINLFDASGSLIDRLTYGDQVFAGTVRTQNATGNPLSAADLAGTTVTANWVLASAGDSFGSYAAKSGDVGNPGFYVAAPVPEPETYALMLAGLALVGGIARRRAAR
ncbi:lamin tail domain-containing protein [Denitromonas ohlonensis]|uniref:PEP-CTERM sorting domain-containing protein n=2 Tax=Denitromonas TaxID=139331 RepID=A0A557RVC3_9RHOO|nr:lamin tail domain-containing protein [Denitromonas ohlonensis]TVO69097.1 PEP-CTERM sorting domain-containing protein [Denitromonas ohlonensis]TVO77197.1 PEP-CTERM sorting domain-containing protein [Denitromonas ohlonensis]